MCSLFLVAYLLIISHDLGRNPRRTASFEPWRSYRGRKSLVFRPLLFSFLCSVLEFFFYSFPFSTFERLGGIAWVFVCLSTLFISLFDDTVCFLLYLFDSRRLRPICQVLDYFFFLSRCPHCTPERSAIPRQHPKSTLFVLRLAGSCRPSEKLFKTPKKRGKDAHCGDIGTSRSTPTIQHGSLLLVTLHSTLWVIGGYEHAMILSSDHFLSCLVSSLWTHRTDTPTGTAVTTITNP